MYLIVWSSPYDSPTMAIRRELRDAAALYQEWGLSDPEATIDVYEVNPVTETISLISNSDMGRILKDHLADRAADTCTVKGCTDLPMPGENFHGSVVIASVWTDEVEALFATLLTLEPVPPFYSIRAIDQSPPGIWHTAARVCYDNIVPAAKAYQEQTGAYGGE